MPHQRPSNADELLRQAQRLIRSPAYYQSSHPDHAQVQRVTRALFEKVYGGQPEEQRKLPPAFYRGSTDHE